MKRALLTVLLLITTSVYGALSSQECHNRWEDFLQEHQLEREFQKLKFKCDDDFKSTLYRLIKAHHKKTGYREARYYMFTTLDNIRGEVCGVYTHECIYTDHIPSSNEMNCEHTWPKSRGASKGMAKYDLHHLFPTKSDINSTRSSYPFCELSSRERGRNGSYLGHSAKNSHIRCFEPRDDHKGDVARAMFYFSIRYQMRIDRDQEFYFRKWMNEDRVSAYEAKRNKLIKDFQGNINPFIVHPEFIHFVQDF